MDLVIYYQIRETYSFFFVAGDTCVKINVNVELENVIKSSSFGERPETIRRKIVKQCRIISSDIRNYSNKPGSKKC